MTYLENLNSLKSDAAYSHLAEPPLYIDIEPPAKDFLCRLLAVVDMAILSVCADNSEAVRVQVFNTCLKALKARTEDRASLVDIILGSAAGIGDGFRESAEQYAFTKMVASFSGIQTKLDTLRTAITSAITSVTEAAAAVSTSTDKEITAVVNKIKRTSDAMALFPDKSSLAIVMQDISSLSTKDTHSLVKSSCDDILSSCKNFLSIGRDARKAYEGLGASAKRYNREVILRPLVKMLLDDAATMLSEQDFISVLSAKVLVTSANLLMTYPPMPMTVDSKALTSGLDQFITALDSAMSAARLIGESVSGVVPNRPAVLKKHLMHLLPVLNNARLDEAIASYAAPEDSDLDISQYASLIDALLIAGADNLLSLLYAVSWGTFVSRDYQHFSSTAIIAKSNALLSDPASSDPLKESCQKLLNLVGASEDYMTEEDIKSVQTESNSWVGDVIMAEVNTIVTVIYAIAMKEVSTAIDDTAISLNDTSRISSLGRQQLRNILIGQITKLHVAINDIGSKRQEAAEYVTKAVRDLEEILAPAVSDSVADSTDMHEVYSYVITELGRYSEGIKNDVAILTL